MGRLYFDGYEPELVSHIGNHSIFGPDVFNSDTFLIDILSDAQTGTFINYLCDVSREIPYAFGFDEDNQA